MNKELLFDNRVSKEGTHFLIQTALQKYPRLHVEIVRSGFMNKLSK